LVIEYDCSDGSTEFERAGESTARASHPSSRGNRGSDGSWGIAILTILVDQRRSFWTGRLGENINEYNQMVLDALRQGAAALQSIGLPHA
jgi:hypothetical protein